jgi:drug/metabolite transporter (DMT)-like permease
MDQGQQGLISRRLNWLGYGACAMAGCLWGMGFFFGKLALREMSVGHMVLYRFLFASLGMLPIVWTAKSRRGPLAAKRRAWTGREVGTLLLSAALGIPIQFLLQFEGLARTTVSHASLLVGTMPVSGWIGWAGWRSPVRRLERR